MLTVLHQPDSLTNLAGFKVGVCMQISQHLCPKLKLLIYTPQDGIGSFALDFGGIYACICQKYLKVTLPSNE
jgi:hypothetical protein